MHGQRRRKHVSRAAIALMLAVVLALVVADVASAAELLQPPVTIKVARRWPANDPNGTIMRVDEVDFRTYCVRVLSHEWAPATSFSPEALTAGALAVKSYGWYWATHTTKLADVRAWGADVDDTVNYQVYMDSDYGDKYWQAVDTVSDLVITENGAVLQASYRAGDYSSHRSGWYMSQWGTEYWADQGRSYQWMVDYYYPGATISPAAGGVAGAETGAADEPQGAARLELVGPIVATPGEPESGDRVTLAFTLRNAGADDGVWDELIVVGRGPGDKARDFGVMTDLKMKGGEYRMFEAHRVVDLGGTWRVWLVARSGDEMQLVADAIPFEMTVRGASIGVGGRAAATTTAASGRRGQDGRPEQRLDGPRRPPEATAAQALGEFFGD
jgi:hypothetical protein